MDKSFLSFENVALLVKEGFLFRFECIHVYNAKTVQIAIPNQVKLNCITWNRDQVLNLELCRIVVDLIAFKLSRVGLLVVVMVVC